MSGAEADVSACHRLSVQASWYVITGAEADVSCLSLSVCPGELVCHHGCRS